MEKLLLYFAVACFAPVTFITGYEQQLNEVSWSGGAFWFLVGCVFLGVLLGWICFKRVMLIRSYQLGLQGERLVGEMLNRMVKDGYDVFHDYPIEPDGRSGNIDHVVVGPNGVFAIETKTVRKPKTVEEGTNYEVTFDGNRLQYPHFSTKKGIGQATHNARLLSKHLSAALDESVEVVPLLTLPGWFVTSQTHQPLRVLNPKTIRAGIRSGKPVMDESKQRKIAHQLQLRCRDVEF